MFDFFTRRTAKDYLTEAKENYAVPEPKTEPDETDEPNEYFRVGATNDGKTTLTFIGDNGSTMTLTMNQQACEQMIRMLRATYTAEQPTETEE